MIERPIMTAPCSTGFEDGKSGGSTSRWAATASATEAAKAAPEMKIEPLTSFRRQDMWGVLAANRPLQKRSEEHTSELQSLMRISYAVFCLKKKIKTMSTIINPLSATIT